MQNPTAAHWNGDEWRWHRWNTATRTAPTLYVTELSEDAQREREAKIKAGARVLPFGFGRALVPDPVERDPLTWEGSD